MIKIRVPVIVGTTRAGRRAGLVASWVGQVAALKNAIDYPYVEGHDQAAGFVSYGVPGGTCAVARLRLAPAEPLRETSRAASMVPA